MKRTSPRYVKDPKNSLGDARPDEERSAGATGRCAVQTTLARASGGGAAPKRPKPAVAASAAGSGVRWRKQPVVTADFEAPRALEALSAPPHKLLTGEVYKVMVARGGGMKIMYTAYALGTSWDDTRWNLETTTWWWFCFNQEKKRVVYYLARDVDAGKAVEPLEEEEIKALIQRELPAQEFMKKGARAASTHHEPFLRLYKQTFPDKKELIGYEYQEVEVVKAERGSDREDRPVLATVTLRFTELERHVLDLSLGYNARVPRYWGLWTVSRKRGEGGVPDEARWGEDDEEAKARYMARIEEQVLGDERLFGRP